ncbi:protein CLT2, chloroplastic isoform X2 [Neltuma alba]|uniref:protein CLT2, chloroplastic isoform X2 n=1 Tax=Neltuma alba TaxID=207710 RepID=UPI0010A37B9F|nr:protein CLT2, chloroplastic isoform X2 [Prosopis alba]
MLAPQPGPISIRIIRSSGRFSAIAFSSTLPCHCFPSRLQFIEPLVPMAFNSREPLHLAGNRKASHSKSRNVHHKRSIFEIQASSSSSSSSSDTDLVLVSSLITVTLAVANRVLYKLALVPMKDFPFFLAQFTTFGYVIIYFTILYIRYRAGVVTRDMMAIPKLRFLAVGFLEALGVATGMSAGAILPGPAIPILNQTFLVWQLIFSTLLLGRRYSINQIAGCLLVATGVVVAIASGSNAGQMLSEVEFFWPALMIVSSAFQAGASIIKESIFINSALQLKGKSLDIFVVNSFGSGFQALFVLLLLPFLSNLKGIPFLQLPSYYKRAAGCFLNTGADTIGCDGAPFLPLLYVVMNLAFNISVLNVVKVSSAVVASLMVMLSVPISVYILSLPLPYLPGGTTFSPFFLLGCAILVCGLALYNATQLFKRGSKAD